MQRLRIGACHQLPHADGSSLGQRKHDIQGQLQHIGAEPQLLRHHLPCFGKGVKIVADSELHHMEQIFRRIPVLKADKAVIKLPLYS